MQSLINKLLILPLSCACSFLSLTVTAGQHEDYKSDDTLHYEIPAPTAYSLKFKHQDPLYPDNSDFALLDVRLMSNRNGERWALITLENTASGQRILESDDIVATFADGLQVNPITIKEKIAGGEIRTVAINFGHHRFPIASVTVSKDRDR